jgi:hypothetical protein
MRGMNPYTGEPGPPKKKRDCDHGQLARTCPICERDEYIEKLEDILGRVYNELSDPMGDYWCEKPEHDRQLLKNLRDYVAEEMGWDAL